jgi:D-xylose transport system substrate-binding protein
MKFVLKLMAGAAIIVSLHSVAHAKDLVVGVSWSNFQEERWKTDEAAIKAALEASGDKYISADAQSSAAKQLTDVESLIAQGANASSFWRRIPKPSARPSKRPPLKASRSSATTA